MDSKHEERDVDGETDEVDSVELALDKMEALDKEVDSLEFALDRIEVLTQKIAVARTGAMMSLEQKLLFWASCFLIVLAVLLVWCLLLFGRYS
jgi:hypothetical protein